MGVFKYVARNLRRHGPKGYVNYQAFKPWLRDEFSYQCAYCLCREKWFPDGDVSFSVDHLRPVSRYPDFAADYENLIYSCCHCNSLKAGGEMPNFLVTRHELVVDEFGVVHSEGIEGKDVIEICRLNRKALVEFRIGILEIIDLFRKQGRDTKRFLGYPDSLPNLTLLRPPGGNSKPEGIQESAFNRKERGELPCEY